MDFNVTEAVELIVLLAETEQLTLQDALHEFITETELDSETASHLKGALFEKYSLKEMAADALTNAMMKVFVDRPVVEEEVVDSIPDGNLYFVEVETEDQILEGYLSLEEIHEMRASDDILSVTLVDEGKKGDKSYLETDMKKRQENNEKARKEMEKVPGQKNPHFEEVSTLRQGWASAYASIYEKKLDPVGQEDKDIDNDGDHDSTDKYLHNRRKAIGKAMGKKNDRPNLADVYGADRRNSKPLKMKKESYEKAIKANQKELDKLEKGKEPATAKRYREMRKESAYAEYLSRRGISEEVFSEGDLIDAGRKNEGERKGKKITGEGVDNSSSVKLMPRIAEAAIVTEKAESKSQQRLFGMVRAAQKGEKPASGKVAELASKVGKKDVLDFAKTKHKGLDEGCGCEEGKKEEKKKKAKIDEAGMPILEYSRNNAEGPTPEMIDPPKDEEGKKGVKNPKGKAKRPGAGDRRPNDGGSELPFDMGTVPGGGGCGC